MTGWTLTGIAARVVDAVGARGRWVTPVAVARAAGLAQRGEREHDTVFARVTSRRIAASTPADRKALETALAEVGADREVIERAAASAAPVAAVAGLAARWDALPAPAKGWIRNPLGRSVGPVKWDATPLTQVDQTTCGAASMGMMTMLTDPFVALWVATGQVITPYQPPEVLRAQVGGGAAHTVAERWARLQRVIHENTTRAALGPLPWPRALGTPPWRVDNRLRCAGVRFGGLLVDDTVQADLAAALAHASAALRDGIPVPLFVGGDSTQGLQGVVPRHVVLLAGKLGEDFIIFEPGSGATYAVSPAQLSQPHARLRALGNWSRVEWMVLPKPRA